MTAQPDLLERVRVALADRDPREVHMFGGISFMVAERMVVAVRGDELLVRVDPADNERLLTATGARPASMGTDRPMGPSWISVGPDGLAGDALSAWLAHALAFHASQASGWARRHVGVSDPRDGS